MCVWGVSVCMCVCVCARMGCDNCSSKQTDRRTNMYTLTSRLAKS